MIASALHFATIRLASIRQPFRLSLVSLQENRLPESRVDLGEFAALQWTRTQLCRQLRSALGKRLDARPVRVGTDVTFYYDPQDRLARVTPDLYVLSGLGYEEQLRSFRVYDRGLHPELVVHLVETLVSPEDGLLMHFLRLGVMDVVLYDPLWWLISPQAGVRGRRLLTHYQREISANGVPSFRLQPQDHPGRVYLPAQRLWLVHRGGADLHVYDASHDAGHADSLPSEAGCIRLPDESAQAAG